MPAQGALLGPPQSSRLGAGSRSPFPFIPALPFMGPAWVWLGQVAMDRGDMVGAPGPPNGDQTELRHDWV